MSVIKLACCAVLGLLVAGAALAQPPEAAKAHFTAGFAAMGGQRYAEAVAELKQALELDKEYVQAHWILAWCYRLMGENALAAEQCREVLRLAPDSDEGNQARSLLQQLGPTTVAAPALAAPQRQTPTRRRPGAPASPGGQPTAAATSGWPQVVPPGDSDGEFWLTTGQMMTGKIGQPVKFEADGRVTEVDGGQIAYLAGSRLFVRDQNGTVTQSAGTLLGEVAIKVQLGMDSVTMTVPAANLEHYQSDRTLTPRFPIPAGLAVTGQLVVAADPELQRQSLLGQASGRVATEIANPANLAWCPSTGAIAFAGKAGQGSDIWRTALDGTGTMRLTEDAGTEKACMSSPDGQYLAYETLVGEEQRLMAVKAEGSNTKMLWPRKAVLVGWRGAYNTILFIDRSKGAPVLVEIAPDGSGAEYVYQEVEAQCAACSPVDGRVAVATGRLLRLGDGENPPVLLEASSDINSLAWSPDGRYVALVLSISATISDGKGGGFIQQRSGIQVVGADGTGLRQVTTGTEDWRVYGWSADSRFLLAEPFFGGTSILVNKQTDRTNFSITFGSGQWSIYSPETGAWYALRTTEASKGSPLWVGTPGG